MSVRVLPLLCLSACSWFSTGVAPVDIPSDHWRVDLVAYAWSDDLPANALTAHGAPTQTTSMAWSFAVLRRDDRVVLVDAGTDFLTRRKQPVGRPKNRLPKHWRISWAKNIPNALSDLGIEPQDVTDVILTHHHWDHVEGIVNLPDANLHVHRDVLTAMSDETFGKGSIPGLATAVRAIEPFAPAEYSPLEGIQMTRTSVHSPGHMVVEVDCGERNALLVGDAAYLRSHVMEGKPSARNPDEPMHLKVLAQLKARVDAGAILVAGHDPGTFSAGPIVNVCE